MSKAIISLPSIDTSNEFTENACICDSLSIILENLRTALSLDRVFATTKCAKAIQAIKSIYDEVYSAKGNLWKGVNTNPLMYKVGLYNYLHSINKDTLGDTLKDINDELVEFIINYRSSYTVNEIGKTLKYYAFIENEEDDDEYI